jgi:hypothetical protein
MIDISELPEGFGCNAAETLKSLFLNVDSTFKETVTVVNPEFIYLENEFGQSLIDHLFKMNGGKILRAGYLQNNESKLFFYELSHSEGKIANIIECNLPKTVWINFDQSPNNWIGLIGGNQSNSK